MIFSSEILWDDISQIESILLERVVDWDKVLDEEIESIISEIKLHVDQTWKTHYVRWKDWDKVLWIVWVKPIEDDEMRKFSKTSNPWELVNLFALKDSWVPWVWKGLINTLKCNAKKLWYTEILLNSWPRYEKAWWFYDKVLWERVWEIKDRYWEWRDAPVWRIEL